MKKRFLQVICCILAVILVFSACSSAPVIESTTEATTVVTTVIDDEVIVPEAVQEAAEQTANDVASGIDVETPTIAKTADESIVEDEDAIENDASVEQENISYDGSSTGNGKSLLGKCSGLTYYSQFDSRWASVMYSNHNDKSQTMKSSGCGPTSAAMVVSSSKGAILPTTMAQLFMANGYRTYSEGTAWSAWSFVADYFGFKDYDDTTNVNTALSYVKQDKNKDGVADYFVVMSCGNGLYTTGGHYVVIMDDTNSMVSTYDPYLYLGKVDTPSRKKANAKIVGNKIVVSEENFKKYANYKHFWIFSNDYVAKAESTTSNSSGTTQSKPANKTPTYTIGKTYTLAVDLKVRTGAGTNYSQKKKSQLTADGQKHALNQTMAVLKTGTKVTAQEVKKENGNIWLKVPSGWICAYYNKNTYIK